MAEAAHILFKEESYRMIGGCFAVYNDKGCGFLEPILHECLEIEFELSGIPFRSKPPLSLTYRERSLMHTFQPDFNCLEKVLLEIKAVAALADEHRAQVINYLAASGCDLGLLVNFGSYPKLQYERLIRGDKIKPLAQRRAKPVEPFFL